MTYCLFENAYYDLENCFDELKDKGIEYLEENASEYEKEYIRKIIQLCKELNTEFGDEV